MPLLEGDRTSIGHGKVVETSQSTDKHKLRQVKHRNYVKYISKKNFKIGEGYH